MLKRLLLVAALAYGWGYLMGHLLGPDNKTLSFLLTFLGAFLIPFLVGPPAPSQEGENK